MSEATNTEVPDSLRLRRILGTGALVTFGLAYLVPLTVFTTFGSATQLTQGHLPLAYLMTTAAMITGLLPLLTASGAGAASRFSIGLVVVAGMSIGTLFTLFVLPAVYVAIATDHRAKAESARNNEIAELELGRLKPT